MTQPEPRAPNRIDRLLAVIPLASIVLWLAVLEMFEVVGRKTPTLFSDELEWTQISRAIAHTGHPARRGEPIFFKTLYVYVLAPVWWIHDTATAYGAAKYLNVTVMCLAALPAYALARRYVSKPAALAVAAATIAIPGMAYSGYLVPEVPAYPWSVLCAWLIVQSLAGRGRRWTAAAVIASALAPLVRLQLAVVPIAFALAAFALWYAGPRGRRLRAGWTRADLVGAWLLAALAFIVFNRAILHHSYQWQNTTEFWRGRIVQYALEAWGALTIGIGIVPTICGLVALFPRREERKSPADRAFLAFLGSALFAYLFYTGLKGAYVSTTFSTLVVERNLIYVAPLLFTATAIVLERRRIRLVPVVVATAAAVFLLAYVPLQLSYPYYEALGFGIADFGNRVLAMSQASIQAWLIGIAVGCGVVVAAFAVAQARGLRAAVGLRAAAGVLAALVLAWNLTGEIYASRGTNDESKNLIAGFPLHPPNVIDKLTGGAGVTYLGQQIGDANGVHLLEFWNRSIRNVWSLDGTAPGPGPSLSPDLLRADGTLRPAPPTPYALTDNGVLLEGTPVYRVPATNLRLYKLGSTWRLRAYQDGISSDGWMSQDSTYTRFVGSRQGTLVLQLSRTAFCPEHGPQPGHAVVRFGPIQVNENHQPVLAPGYRTRRLDVANCKLAELRIPVGAPPWRIEVHIPNLFRPSDYNGSDGRALGAQVGYVYKPG